MSDALGPGWIAALGFATTAIATAFLRSNATEARSAAAPDLRAAPSRAGPGAALVVVAVRRASTPGAVATAGSTRTSPIAALMAGGAEEAREAAALSDRGAASRTSSGAACAGVAVVVVEAVHPDVALRALADVLSRAGVRGDAEGRTAVRIDVAVALRRIGISGAILRVEGRHTTAKMTKLGIQGLSTTARARIWRRRSSGPSRSILGGPAADLNTAVASPALPRIRRVADRLVLSQGDGRIDVLAAILLRDAWACSKVVVGWGDEPRVRAAQVGFMVAVGIRPPVSRIPTASRVHAVRQIVAAAIGLARALLAQDVGSGSTRLAALIESAVGPVGDASAVRSRTAA